MAHGSIEAAVRSVLPEFGGSLVTMAVTRDGVEYRASEGWRIEVCADEFHCTEVASGVTYTMPIGELAGAGAEGLIVDRVALAAVHAEEMRVEATMSELRALAKCWMAGLDGCCPACRKPVLPGEPVMSRWLVSGEAPVVSHARCAARTEANHAA